MQSSLLTDQSFIFIKNCYKQKLIFYLNNSSSKILALCKTVFSHFLIFRKYFYFKHNYISNNFNHKFIFCYLKQPTNALHDSTCHTVITASTVSLFSQNLSFVTAHSMFLDPFSISTSYILSENSTSFILLISIYLVTVNLNHNIFATISLQFSL